MNNNLVEEREILASQLTESAIWRSIVQNVISMENCTLDDKINILFQAIPDLGIILSQLSLCKSLKLLDETEYNDIMKASLIKLARERRSMDYNPLYFSHNG